jgi:DNA-binding transcriptional MocR family regulator
MREPILSLMPKEGSIMSELASPSAHLVKSSATPLAQQLADRFVQRIKAHLLAPGSRLPSVRQCAAQQQVSTATVVAAYDRLVALGYVEAQRNRGFYVRPAQHPGVPLANAPRPHTAPVTPAQRSAPVNAGALIRGMFHRLSDQPQPGLGVFPSDWLDNTFLSTAVRQVMAQGVNRFSYEYGEPQGDTGLRRALVGKLGLLNVTVGADQIITTVGATQALDIVSRTVLRPGDAVMVEEPGWAIEFARLTALGMRILPVPRDANGPNLQVIANYCANDQPKLYVSVSVLHNPTGYCLPPSSAYGVLKLAHAHQFWIVEDDTYSHLAPDHATRLCALDGLERTIYIGGFAKVLAPNWRVGYLAAPDALREALLETKLLTTLTTPAFFEKSLALCIEQGHLRRHADRLRARLAQARHQSVKLALAHGCTFAAEPSGLFGWVDTGVDTDALSQHLFDRGYLIAPGALFHANRVPSTLMRINFATTQQPAFWKVFGELVKAA